ncbi:Reductive dehalogenase membrane anchor protein [Brevibacillus sp. IT-7CA2]
MENALIAFATSIMVGAIFLGILWWEGSWFSLRFTKWYFGILFVVSIGVGGYTLFQS